MKILIALHSVMDLGGIINHTEQLIGGLKELGHTVHLKEFVYATNAYDQSKGGFRNWQVGPSGIPHDQGKGWNFPRFARVPYKGTAALGSARTILSDYDMVVWTVPVPSKNQSNLGNEYWIQLYDLPERIKQVAFVHDGNIRQGAPHILAIQERLSGVACVHACALNGADFLSVPRTLVLNPQERPVRDINPWRDKQSGFVNMQTFKAWKHAHELIEAIAYMPKIQVGELRHVAGMGIEYQYMTSEEKCKPEYFHADGRKYWDAAIQNGMIHDGYWDTPKVEEMLGRARVLVDPSWSTKYSKIGGHWNRVVVDAMVHGAIPVARPMGMGDELFKPWEHYVPLMDEVKDPRKYAEVVLWAGNLNPSEASTYRQAALQILPSFERKTVAKRLIDLAYGSVDDVLIGKSNPSIKQKASDLLFDHFGIDFQ